MPPVIRSLSSLALTPSLGLEVQPAGVVIHSDDAGTRRMIAFEPDEADEMGLALIRAAQASREMRRIQAAPTLPGLVVPNGNGGGRGRE